MNSIYKAGISAIGLSLMLLTDVNAAKAKSVVNEGWKITWNDGGATARNQKTGKEITLFKDDTSDEEGDSYSNDYTMLSVVGTTVSWSYTWYAEGGAHPTYGEEWYSVNLDSAAVNLAALFGEEAVFTRLMQDPVVQMAAGGGMADKAGPPKPNPNNLTQLLEQADGGCFAAMGDNLLTDYYFAYRLGGNIAVVQIGLTYGCEVNRGNFTKLNKLYFPIPREMKKDFRRAVKKGVLEDIPFQKTSFNCAKAGTTIEFTICADAAVAKLDIAMAKQYKAARRAASGEARKRIKKDQRAWIANRNRECSWPGNEMLYDKGEFFGSIEACLVNSYEKRLAALK
ncbi:MAG: DUF1311 domain-containing protein [Proteobacteria bacterium]|nr:DUF1311 domain-containing protein [Pseudomonadota bacterium]